MMMDDNMLYTKNSTTTNSGYNMKRGFEKSPNRYDNNCIELPYNEQQHNNEDDHDVHNTTHNTAPSRYNNDTYNYAAVRNHHQHQQHHSGGGGAGGGGAGGGGGSKSGMALSSGSLGSEDDDHLSSASESSYCKIADVEEVNTIARLQEESLKLPDPRIRQQHNHQQHHNQQHHNQQHHNQQQHNHQQHHNQHQQENNILKMANATTARSKVSRLPAPRGRVSAGSSQEDLLGGGGGPTASYLQRPGLSPRRDYSTATGGIGWRGGGGTTAQSPPGVASFII